MTEPRLTDLDIKIGLIGQICLHWSYLELLLATTIWNILKLDEDTGKIVTGGLDIEGRANMALNLAKHRKAPADVIAVLKCAQSQIKDIIGERNLAIHGVYELRPTGEVLAEVHRGKFRGIPQDMSNDRMGRTAQTIDAIIEILQPVLEKHGVIDFRPPGPGSSQ
jgi:hypothetical protein